MLISTNCISPCSKLKKEPKFLQQKTLVCIIEVLLNAILDNKLSLTHILNSEVYTGVNWMKIYHFWFRRKSELGVSRAIIYSDLACEHSLISFPKLLRPLRLSYFYFVSSPGGGGTPSQYLY